jgi:hypothetical protein
MVSQMNTTAARLRSSHALALSGRSVWEWNDDNSRGEIVVWGKVDPDTLAARVAAEGAEYFDDISCSSVYRVRVRRVQLGAGPRVSWSAAERRGAPEGSGSVELHPSEPACSHVDGHEWEQSRSPRSDGAGVRYHEECTHCRTLKRTCTNRQECSEFFDAVSYTLASEREDLE